MKKIAMMLAALLTISLSACSQGNKKENKEMKKVLIAYFSASGVTEGVAMQLAEVTGGDLHKIQPEQPYTDADLDWRDKQSRSSVEMQDKNSRPAITNKLANMQDYDVVYVGFPIWWYTAPTIINTFLVPSDTGIFPPRGENALDLCRNGGGAVLSGSGNKKWERNLARL